MQKMRPQGEGREGQEQGTQVERPRTRADCMDGPRPCPWISCRYHLFDEVAHRILHVPKDGLRDMTDDKLVRVLLGMEYTCVLDWAAKGPNTLEEIGRMFGVTRERIRQIQDKGLSKLKVRGGSRKGEIIELLQDLAEKKGVLEWK